MIRSEEEADLFSLFSFPAEVVAKLIPPSSADRQRRTMAYCWFKERDRKDVCYCQSMEVQQLVVLCFSLASTVGIWGAKHHSLFKHLLTNLFQNRKQRLDGGITNPKIQT